MPDKITFGPVEEAYDETVKVFRGGQCIGEIYRYPGEEWTVDVDLEAAGAMGANGRTLSEIKRDVRKRLAESAAS